MPDDPVRIFVSYARDDRRWVDRNDSHHLIPHLISSLRKQNVEVWFDAALVASEVFKRTIEQEIRRADIAVLLVSQSFLNSEFIEAVELPEITKRTEDPNFHVVPILIGYSDWQELEILAERQVLPGPPPTPLIDYTTDPAKWDKVRFEITSEIKQLVNRVREIRSQSTSSADSEAKTTSAILHDLGHEAGFDSIPGEQPVSGPAMTSHIVVVESDTKQPNRILVSPVLAASLDATEPAPGDRKINPIDGAEMIWIPPGPFLMGDDDIHDNPRRTVTLSGYWIYKNLVTVGQYKHCCNATRIAMPAAPNFNLDWAKEDHPMVNVSLYDAMSYCKWAEASLPTEAQWEKAAKGTDGRRFPWGRDWDSGKVWGSRKELGDAGGTIRAGVYGISLYGCSDMAGNVWQWCADWYDADYSKSAPANDPSGPPVGDQRVLRGSSWYSNDPDYFRSAFRLTSAADNSNSNYGFRCVLNPEKD